MSRGARRQTCRSHARRFSAFVRAHERCATTPSTVLRRLMVCCVVLLRISSSGPPRPTKTGFHHIAFGCGPAFPTPSAHRVPDTLGEDKTLGNPRRPRLATLLYCSPRGNVLENPHINTQRNLVKLYQYHLVPCDPVATQQHMIRTSARVSAINASPLRDACIGVLPR
jgi:hypothetical protein